MSWHNGRPSGWYPGSFERQPARVDGGVARGVAPWVRQLTEEAIGGSALRVGGRYLHPEDGEIEVTDGQYWGTHGVSNFWHWTVVATGEKKHGYGGRWPEAVKAERDQDSHG